MWREVDLRFGGWRNWGEGTKIGELENEIADRWRECRSARHHANAA